MLPERYHQDLKAVGISEPIETAIRRRALPSWETVDGMLELRTHNNRVHHSLYERYREELKGYYDSVYDSASGIETQESGPVLPRAGLAYHFRIIRETVSGQPEKVSKGWAKRVRNEKATSRK